jgi:hypothetical protein
MSLRPLLLAFAFTLLALPVTAQTTPDATASTAPVKIGAYYFDGWNPQASHVTDRLKTEFANREPVWGWMDDTPAVMQQQIDLAANGGLSFWSFCWYWPEYGGPESPLNNALALYLQAPNRARLQFCLMVANHSGYRIGPKDWPAVSAAWIALFKQPTYLTVDGKPLLIFFSTGELLKAFGSPAAVSAAFDQLRADARAAGLPGVSIAACTLPGPQNGWPDLEPLRACGFDVFTGYNYSGAGRTDPVGKEQHFADLIPAHEKIWDLFAQNGQRPCIPLVTIGFDRRPWELPSDPDAKHGLYYPDRTPALVEQIIAQAVTWVKANPTHATAERLVLLYAWNENGEGGYLTPTKAEGSVYLDTVNQALQAK